MAAPPDLLTGLGGGAPGKGKEGGERREGTEGKDGEGVQKCSNPELASLRRAHG